MSPSRTTRPLLAWCPRLMAGVLTLLLAAPVLAAPMPGVEVDERDDPALVESAIRAFDYYLNSVDQGDFDDARQQALDPGTPEGRVLLVEKLLGFIRSRRLSEIDNEGVVVRMQGDWALVVYQYDTTANNKTTRIITTAWMIKSEGYWRQFLVSPSDRAFWAKHREDYEVLRRWFDGHARRITGAPETPIEQPV